jgi:hypothetical protein
MATEEISELTLKKETVLILTDFKILLFIGREREQLHGTIIKHNHFHVQIQNSQLGLKLISPIQCVTEFHIHVRFGLLSRT